MEKKLEDQVKDWETIKLMLKDSRKMFQADARNYLRNEVYPKIKEYVTKYQIKYNVLEKPHE